MSNKLKGKLGENRAKEFLLKNGFKILETNFRYSRYGEIDIIAAKNDILYFVEVKYRTTNKFGMPLEAITKAKLKKICNCANYYLTLCDKKFKSYKISALSVFNDDINFIESVEC